MIARNNMYLFILNNPYKSSLFRMKELISNYVAGICKLLLHKIKMQSHVIIPFRLYSLID